MDGITALERSYQRLTEYVNGLDTSQLSAATPCAEWNVRALLNHTLGAVRLFTVVNHGESMVEDADDLLAGTRDLLKGDPPRALAEAAQQNLESWRQPGALDGDRTYSFGTFPAPAALMINVDEIATHGWDLARATGQDAGIDAEVAETLYGFFSSISLDKGRAVGFYGAIVPVPETAPVADRLLGLLGRQP